MAKCEKEMERGKRNLGEIEEMKKMKIKAEIESWSLYYVKA